MCTYMPINMVLCILFSYHVFVYVQEVCETSRTLGHSIAVQLMAAEYNLCDHLATNIGNRFLMDG